jgi:hypothetical protein
MHLEAVGKRETGHAERISKIHLTRTFRARTKSIGCAAGFPALSEEEKSVMGILFPRRKNVIEVCSEKVTLQHA